MSSSIFVTTILIVNIFGAFYFVNADPEPNREYRFPKNYKKDTLPPQKPVDIQIGFLIQFFGPVDTRQMTVSWEVYLRQFYRDERLKDLYKNLIREHAADNKSQVEDEELKNKTVFLAGDYYNKIWKPDVYFPDAVELDRPIMEPDDSIQLQVNNEGSFLYSTRLIVKTRCRMKMTFFPLDLQECPICVSHYKYPVQEQLIRWFREPVEMVNDLSTPHFQVEPHVTNTTTISETLNNNYTKLCAHIKFRRKLHQYMFVMYFPSFILTGLSFLNFWIDKKAVPARASLSITSILAQITLMTGISVNFPSGSDLKIIDVYMMVNFIFTVLTIIEFTIVSYSSSEKRIIKQKTQRCLQLGPEKGEDNDEAGIISLLKPKSKDLDVISRYILITLFLIWNIGYGLMGVFLYHFVH